MQKNEAINILALCAIYNRSLITIKCLDSFYRQSLQFGEINLTIAVVDDLSTDNSIELIKKKFPDIKIITTSGNFYWAKSMAYGFKKFWNNSYDFLIAFNDDIILNSNAIQNIVANYFLYKKIYPTLPITIAGSFFSNDSNKKSLSYGGLNRIKNSILNFKIQTPNNDFQVVDVINMNFALIDKQSITLTNFLDDRFIHSGADFDYALRLKKKKGVCIIGRGYSGICPRNINHFEFFDPKSNLNLCKKFQLLFSPKGLPITNYVILLKHYYKFTWFFYTPIPCIKVFFMHLLRSFY